MSSSGAPAVRPASRQIARAAVQAELSLAAYELVVEKGYGNVTLDDMAAAGGVSRSTFLRYFRTKDQAILVALKAYVERMADALRARPREEDDWSALPFPRGPARAPPRVCGRAGAAAARAARRARPAGADSDWPVGQGGRRA